MTKEILNTPKRGRGRPPISLKNRLNEVKATTTPIKEGSAIVEVINKPIPEIDPLKSIPLTMKEGEIVVDHTNHSKIEVPISVVKVSKEEAEKMFPDLPIANEKCKEIVEENTEIDFLEFENGKNKLKISLFKKHNRMFRIQIFLNDHTEIRPTTYTGSSMALSFWNLLKESLKG